MGRFGQKLRYLRTRQQLTQVELAKRLNLATHAHVSNLEQSRFEPSLEIIVAIANLFVVKVEYLVREDLPPQAAEDGTYQRHPGEAPLAVQAFAPHLAQLRVDAGLLQVQLAAQLGLTANAHVSSMERGHRLPSVELLLRIAEFFGTTVDDLLTPSP